MTKARKTIAWILIAALLVSVGAGFGAFVAPVEKLTAEAKSGVINPNTGVYNTIQQNGTLGSATNPFVVLEIVPNPSMAQFGYLVGGQEPISVAEMMIDAESVPSYLSPYLTATIDKSVDPIVEFVNLIPSDDWSDMNMHWGFVQQAHQYGEFVRAEDNKGAYDPVFADDWQEDESGDYTKVSVWRELSEEEFAEYSDTRYEKYERYVLKDDPAYADYEKVDAEGVTYDYKFVEVEPGTGEYSKSYKKYVKVEQFATSAEYSTLYEKASSGGTHNFYPHVIWETSNGLKNITDGWTHNYANFKNQGSFVVFKYVDSIPDEFPKKLRYQAKEIFKEVVDFSTYDWRNSYFRLYSLSGEMYQYHPTDDNGSHYVFFSQDDNGSYIVDKSASVLSNITQNYYPYTYKGTDYRNTGWFVPEDGGEYKVFSGSGVAEPAKLGTLKNGDKTIYLGEWRLEEDVQWPGTDVYPVRNEEIVSDSDSQIFVPYKNWTHPDTGVDDDIIIFPGDTGRFIKVYDYKASSSESAKYVKDIVYKKVAELAPSDKTDGKNYRFDHKITDIVANTTNTGAYNLDPDSITHANRLLIEKTDESGNNKVPEYEATVSISDADYTSKKYPDKVKRVLGVVDVYQGYKGTRESTELFKKYALGLAYKDNDVSKGEDTLGYTFDGWFYEPEGVNKFNASAKITEDTTIYARWISSYSSTVSKYQVTFDANVPEGTEETVVDGSMPSNISSLDSGADIVEPKAVPLLKGYYFKGWYKDAENTQKYDFTKKILDNVTVYAGWEAIPETTYIVSFDANPGIGVTDDSIAGVPDSSGALFVNFTGRNEEMKSVSDRVASPTRDNYTFSGWYLNRECTIKYTDNMIQILEGMGDTTYLTVSDSDKALTLYAGWIENSRLPKYKVTFIANKPASAVANVANSPAEQLIEYGNSVTEGDINKISLEGNIVQKLKDYHVEVITATPEDFIDKNMALIDRANLIVFNGNNNSDLTSLFMQYRNTTLFSKKAEEYAAAKLTKTSFLESDITYDTMMRIYNRIAGTNGATVCPVVYDYSAYVSAVTGGKGQNVQNPAKLGGKKDVTDISAKTGIDKRGSDNNVYKLFLLTQQINPVTLYNAYIKGANPVIYKFGEQGFFKGYKSDITNMDSQKYWNRYTLIPYYVIEEQDWDNYDPVNYTTPLDVIGITLNPNLSDSFSKVNNRVLIYNGIEDGSADKSIISAFTTAGEIKSTANPDMNQFFRSDADDISEDYTVANAIYYLLNSSESLTNYSEDLSILEIEPSDNWRDDNYWFWYMSRYVPNFSGSCKVTKTSSWEFIGNIEDLNSRYDAIFIGVDNTALPAYYKNTLMPVAPTTKTVTKDTPYVVEKTQEMRGFYRLEIEDPTAVNVSHREMAGYTKVPGHYIDLRVSGDDLIYVSDVKTDEALKIRVGHGTNRPSWLPSWFPVVDTKYELAGKIYYNIGLKSDAAENVKIEFKAYNDDKANNSGEVKKEIFIAEILWERGQFFINDYWYSAPTATWVYYESDTVKKGETVKFAEDRDVLINATGAVYAYSHNGRKVDSKFFNDNFIDAVGELFGYESVFDFHLHSRQGIFGEYNYATEKQVHNGNDDDIDGFIYPGNDITEKKYNALISFLNAGYPIILSKDVLSGNQIDATKIDTASYLYKFIDKLMKDYPASCFVENDTEHDAAFLDALKNKSFSLRVHTKPVEYHDAARPASENYINASDPTDESLKKLQFEFTIETAKTSTYSLHMYVDSNADGKFSVEDELLDSLEIYDNTVRRSVKFDELKGGHRYTVSRILQDYVGAIPWRLEVVDNTKPTVKNDLIGISAIKVADEDSKFHLSVVQILSDRNNSILLPVSNENPSATSVAGRFKQFTSELTDFEIEFYRITAAQLTDIVNRPSTKVGDVETPRWSGVNNAISIQNNKLMCKVAEGDPVEADMIIIGFDNFYDGLNDEKVLKFIEDMTNEGKATMFTHDTTSFVNYYTNTEGFLDKLINGFYAPIDRTQPYWGYQINQHFRQILGMDRYDVMTNRGKTSGGILSEAKDKPWATGTSQRDSNIEKKTSIAYSNIGDAGTVALNQGLTPWNLFIANFGAELLNSLVSYHSANKVQQANVGQVNTYPYRITSENGQSIDIAPTHGQYYQLDLEGDDIVVWYTLQGTDDSRGQNVFSQSRDVRSNYYIYNRGNITYTGMGHSGNLGDMEIKLFVNTMVASYRASTQASRPIITNRDKSSYTENIEYLYIDYDATVDDPDTADPFGKEIETIKFPVEYIDAEGNMTAPTSYDGTLSAGEQSGYAKRIFFELKNNSIALRKILSVSYYPAIRNTSTGKVTVFANYPLSIKTYRYDEDALGNITSYSPTTASGNFNYRFEDEGDFIYEVQNKGTIISDMKGDIVEPKYGYYADIPISDSYYDTLYYTNAAGKRVYLTEKGRTDAIARGVTNVAAASETGIAEDAGYALDKNNKFEVHVHVVMRYGKAAANTWKTGYRDTVFIKRGMFALD